MKRFIIIYCILAILSSLVIGSGYYWLTNKRSMENVELKAEFVQSYLASSNAFFKEHQKTALLELLGADTFYPELTLGFMVTRMTWEIFKKKNPDTSLDFSLAALNPLNTKNLANQDERDIITVFNNNPSLPKQKGTVTKDGLSHFFLATPIRVWNEKCLRCHGDPADAPRFQVEMYGTEHGYNWELEQVVGSRIVYVNIDEEAQKIIKDTIAAFGVSLLCFLITLGLLLYFLKDEE